MPTGPEIEWKKARWGSILWILLHLVYRRGGKSLSHYLKPWKRAQGITKRAHFGSIQLGGHHICLTLRNMKGWSANCSEDKGEVAAMLESAYTAHTLNWWGPGHARSAQEKTPTPANLSELQHLFRKNLLPAFSFLLPGAPTQEGSGQVTEEKAELRMRKERSSPRHPNSLPWLQAFSWSTPERGRQEASTSNRLSVLFWREIEGFNFELTLCFVIWSDLRTFYYLGVTGEGLGPPEFSSGGRGRANLTSWYKGPVPWWMSTLCHWAGGGGGKYVLQTARRKCGSEACCQSSWRSGSHKSLDGGLKHDISHI